MREIWSEIRKHALFYGALAFYGIASFMIALGADATEKFIPLVYLPRWVRNVAGVLSLYVAYLAILSVRAENPLGTLKSRLTMTWTPERIAGGVLFFSLAILHGIFTSTKTMLPHLQGFVHDPTLAAIDAAIHGQDAWKYLKWMNDWTWLVQGLYGQAWFASVVALSLIATLSARAARLRSQFVWTFFLCWAVLGNFVALLGMSAGPILYLEVTGDPRFVELTTHVESVAGSGSAAFYKEVLWNAYVTDTAGEGTGISAFPSLHLSMATLFFLFTRRLHPWAGLGFLLFGALIMLGSVHLGWHYAIDGYFSIIATVLLWCGVGWVLTRVEERQLQATTA